MYSCPQCGSEVYSHRWQTVSTERGGAYTVFTYITIKCSENCGYARTTSDNSKRFEHA
jgi:uncharacterized Zn finger protein